ncbi:MAG: hypothetical protein MUC71_08670 [Steroidobacteraceae bacterium]|jgi:hypothetical protein|nr:hypothetical protein [Steroidobacteraceae bacterium]
MSTIRAILVLLAAGALAACGGGGGNSGGSTPPASPIVVNSLADIAAPPAGTVTLRSAMAHAIAGQTITFDPSLDGGTISLTLVAEEHTILKGEVMGMRNEPSGPVSYLVGYLDRDYGRSALFAHKDVVMDASALPRGITLEWTGGDDPGARVLAVYGDLTLVNVAITGGRSVAQRLPVTAPDDQPWTLARGGALAVWGVAKLVDCRLYGNSVEGDFDSSRDRGAFGGAVYADIVEIEDCTISGNSVLGGGAAGGGVYVVGGAGSSRPTSTIARTAVTGNRIQGLFTYGGGVYSDGGGIGNSRTLRVTSSTIARNLASPAPGLPPFVLAQGYWRGAGLYMSNGYMELLACTIVENETQGVPRTDSLGRRNLAGGIAATVGNAHAVEHLILGHSIVAGNVVQEIGGGRYPQDIFTGSLFYFRSAGHNRLGAIDFSQILVPVGEPGWASLSRKHYPQVGDENGVAAADVLDLAAGITYSDSIISTGADAGGPAVRHYAPRGSALARVPAGTYEVSETLGEYEVAAGGTDDFLQIMLGRIESRYALPGFAAAFAADFEAFLKGADSDASLPGPQPYRDPDGNAILTLADTHFFGPAETWPRELANHPYIEFWHRLDAALAAHAIAGMSVAMINDDVWRTLFTAGALAENSRIRMTVSTQPRLTVSRPATDQRGTLRPSGGAAAIGAIEAP